MKKICLFIALGFLLSSCQKKNATLLPAQEVYLIAFHYDFLRDIENDTIDRFRVAGLSHIDKHFVMNIVSPKNYKGDYLYSTVTFSDSIKVKLSQVINKYGNDSIFELEEDYALIYDGPTYLFLIKKEGKDDYIRLSGIPHTFPEDLNFLREQIGSDYIFSAVEKLVTNQDSLKQEIKKIEKEALRCLIFREFPSPLPEDSTIKFIPPNINDNE